MKKTILFMAVLSLVLLQVSTAHAQKKKKKSKVVELKTETDSLSYAIGQTVGNQFKGQLVEIKNSDAFLEGLMKALSSDTTILLKEGDAINIARKYFNDFPKRADENEKKYFATNKKGNDSIKETASGIQYKVLIKGDGPKPSSADAKVKTHYEGKLLDGKVFDSSYERGTPATFGLNQVIKGWTEILQLMPTGSKWRVYIPYSLAYGVRGNRGIPPCSTLIFDIELIEIVSE